jgi:hypothetical protein
MADTLAAIAMAVFAIGIVVGVIVIASIGIRREELDSLRTSRVSLTTRPPAQAARAVRHLAGFVIRRPLANPSHRIPFPGR